MRGRRADAAPICTFCDRPPAAVTTLVAGPAVYICNDCIARAGQVIAGGTDPDGRLAREANARARCSFCQIRRSKTTAMVTGPAKICRECLELCRQIVEQRTE
jgi:ATP-dependent protease Clp ATPase subunit